MASKTSVVLYCKFCDQVLTKDDKVVRCDSDIFCSEDCCFAWKKETKKASVSAGTLMIEDHKATYEMMKNDIKPHMVKSYAKFKYKLCLGSGILELHSRKRLEACIYGHIANGNKAKAIQKFDKYKAQSNAQIDAIVFDSEEINLQLQYKQGYTSITGEEAVRVQCELLKISIDTFDFLISRM